MSSLVPKPDEEYDYNDRLDDRRDFPGSQVVHFDHHSSVEVWRHCCSKSLRLVVVDLVLLLGVRFMTDVGRIFG